MSSELLEKILAESPKFHRGDTETRRIVSEQQTSLRGSMLRSVVNKVPECYGIDPGLARFLLESVREGSKTLETGSGISTLVFALRHCWHTAVTPSAEEAENIRSYAAANGISMDRVEFAIEPSDRYLPRCEAGDLDLVLIDG